MKSNSFKALLSNILVIPIRLYQILISPILGPNCRFYPTCSDYSIQSIRIHGPIIGFYYTFKRLIKCHPFHPGGYDPVICNTKDL